jgi:hypothetical protein
MGLRKELRGSSGSGMVRMIGGVAKGGTAYNTGLPASVASLPSPNLASVPVLAASPVPARWTQDSGNRASVRGFRWSDSVVANDRSAVPGGKHRSSPADRPGSATRNVSCKRGQKIRGRPSLAALKKRGRECQRPRVYSFCGRILISISPWTTRQELFKAWQGLPSVTLAQNRYKVSPCRLAGSCR